MSVISEEKLEEIQDMIYDGQLKEVIKLTENLLKKNKLNEIDKYRLIVLQSQAYMFLNDAAKSVELTDKILAKFDDINDDLMKLDVLYQRAFALNVSGALKESMVCVEQGFSIIKSSSEADKKKIYYREAFLNYIKSLNLYFMGRGEESFSYGESAYKVASDSESLFVKIVMKLWYGFIRGFQGNHSEADKLSDEAFVVAQREEKKLLLGISYYMVGTNKFITKKYAEAIELLEKSIDIFKEIGSSLAFEGIYNHLGNAYSKFHDFEKTVEYYELAINENGPFKSGISSNLANIYLITNDIEKAHELYKSTLDQSKKIGMLLVLPYAYYQLILTSFLMNKNDLAEKYFEELKHQHNNSDNPHLRNRYQQAQILMLKNSSKIQDWLEAIKLIENLLEDETFPDTYRFDNLYHLVELRLKELQLTADKEVLAEVKKQIDIIHDYAENNKQLVLKANLYRLKSQLSLVELNVEKAIEFLITAKTIATERNYSLIVENVKKDLDKINEQKNMWINLQEQKAPLEDTLKQVKIDNSARQIADETIVEVRAEGTDEVINYRKLFALKL
jgi:tetratricopeptide (TPR) repeat protein